MTISMLQLTLSKPDHMSLKRRKKALLLQRAGGEWGKVSARPSSSIFPGTGCDRASLFKLSSSKEKIGPCIRDSNPSDHTGTLEEEHEGYQRKCDKLMNKIIPSACKGVL